MTLPACPPLTAEVSGAVAHLAPAATAVFARQPLVDARYPRTSDLDLLAFGQVSTVLPERLWPAGPPVDVIWLPEALLEAPERLATYGVMAHRVATSLLVFDPSGVGARAAQAVAEALPAVQGARVAGFLSLGRAAVVEVGVTWDLPELARFWLQIALSACITAMADLRGLYVPNAYTRPLEALEAIGQRWPIPPGLSPVSALLDLDGVDPLAQLPALRALHGRVTKGWPEPAWPEGYRQDTRYEYRYYSDSRELDWRCAVIEEMVACGDPQQAALYLRFWAYSLARLPMVSRRVGEGVSVAFGRPHVAVLPDLMACAPELVAPLKALLGGRPPGRATLEARIEAVVAWRDAALALAAAAGLETTAGGPWLPVEVKGT